jgi:di/tricarboxylate transporter
LQSGDVLLLVAPPSFQEDELKRHGGHLNTVGNLTGQSFALVRKIQAIQPPRKIYKAIIAATLTATAILLATFSVIELLPAALFAVAIMIITQCLTADDARNSLSWEVLITVAISFGLGTAMQNSGAAQIIANALVKAAEPTGEVGLMSALYFVTVFLNAILTNNAAVAVLFPVVNAAVKVSFFFFFFFFFFLNLLYHHFNQPFLHILCID